MHRFDYTFLDEGLLPANLVGLTAEVCGLQARSLIREDEYPAVYSELEFMARVQSVKGSNAIEGIVTSDERIKQIVSKSTAPRDHDELEIAGYRDALALVHDHYEDLDFCERDILHLHELLFSFLPVDDAGHYKSTDNVLLETAADGTRSIRFEPVSARETPAAMRQLVFAYKDAESNVRINRLLLVPCVILDFLCVHPFRDGNGRLSRLLTLLLLYKMGFNAGKYVSLEQQINVAKSAYYQALKESSTGWHESANDYAPFMRNTLTSLYRCYSELDKRFATSQSRRVTKTERIERTVLDALVPISKSEICSVLPDVSPTTVEAVLGKMVKSGVIRRVGAGRATRYLAATTDTARR